MAKPGSSLVALDRGGHLLPAHTRALGFRGLALSPQAEPAKSSIKDGLKNHDILCSVRIAISAHILNALKKIIENVRSDSAVGNVSGLGPPWRSHPCIEGYPQCHRVRAVGMERSDRQHHPIADTRRVDSPYMSHRPAASRASKTHFSGLAYSFPLLEAHILEKITLDC